MPTRVLRASATAAALGFAAACGGSPPATPEPAPPPAATPFATLVAPLRLARVNGTLLHFRLIGDSGTPVVFLHGSLGSLRDWDTQVGTFARRHRVLAYSRRYHPPNQPADDGRVYSPGLHAEDLAALLQALDLGPAHVVGHAYGAFAALVFALEHPHMVRSLVLGEPLVLPLLLRTPEGDSIRRAFVTRALDPAAAAYVRGDSVEGVRRFFDGVAGGPGRFDGLTRQARAARLAASPALRREMLADRRQYLPDLACEALERIASPVLLLEGEHAPRMFHVILEELARCLRTDTLIVVPGVGHGVQTNAAFFNQAVLRFLTSH